MKNFELTRLRSQLAELVQQNQDLAEQVADERHSRVKNQGESALAAQNVKAPRQLAQILLAENVLVERNGELRLRTERGTFSVDEALPQLLASPDYEHYRSSATAKGTPGTVDPTLELDLKHLKNGVPSTEEMQRIMRSPQALNELHSELDSLMPQLTTANATPTSQWPTEQTSNAMPSDSEIASALNDPQAFDQLLAKYV